MINTPCHVPLHIDYLQVHHDDDEDDDYDDGTDGGGDDEKYDDYKEG